VYSRFARFVLVGGSKLRSHTVESLKMLLTR